MLSSYIAKLSTLDTILILLVFLGKVAT